MSAPGLAAEFAFIERHFARLAGEGSLGLRDDAAVIAPRAGRDLVIAADAMVENVHFLPDDPPHDLGRKLLRANLSDLAAMGADPRFYLLTICVPRRLDDAFFAAFADGLALDQARWGVTLLGGDTTGTPGPFSMSITVLGDCPVGSAVRRGGARPGDVVLVTGTIGAGALGLRALRGEIEDPDGTLAAAYRLPEPRLGLAIRGLANAAIDVSDGLLQDAGHLARTSGVALEIEADRVPLPKEARGGGDAMRAFCLAGGDDYELLLAAPPAHVDALADGAARAGVTLTPIGRVCPGPAAVVLRDAAGARLVPERSGFSHF